MRIAIVSGSRSATDEELSSVRVPDLEVVHVTPTEAVGSLTPSDVALGRLDVRPGLDGVEDGLWSLGVLEARGITVLNGPATLIAAHDKLVTARILRRAGLPHPETWHVRPGRPYDGPPAPVVLKPRHGSWGRHVVLCETEEALRAELRRVREEPWFRQHGALVQELVPPTGSDLRLVVAGAKVVGAVSRVAREGEWRTNVALGATRVPLEPPPAAAELARSAAKAVGASLVGVDLLETPDDGFTILEVNGAVEFTAEYRPHGDVFRETVLELVGAVAGGRRAALGSLVTPSFS